MAWSPRQAAERDATRLTLLFEQLEDSAKARRGFHRFLSIANTHGRKEVTLAGIKLEMPNTTQPAGLLNKQRRGGKVGVPAHHSRSDAQRNGSEARRKEEKEKIEPVVQRKEQQGTAPQGAPPPPPQTQPVVLPPGLLPQPMPSTSSTPTSAAASAKSAQQPESMDDTHVFHFAAGGKRGAPLSPAAAKATTAVRALPKKGREGSPEKGLNPSAAAFQPTAAAEQSGQQIGAAANFTRTFTRPASSRDNVRGSMLSKVEHSGHSAPAGIIPGSSDTG